MSSRVDSGDQEKTVTDAQRAGQDFLDRSEHSAHHELISLYAAGSPFFGDGQVNDL